LPSLSFVRRRRRAQLVAFDSATWRADARLIWRNTTTGITRPGMKIPASSHPSYPGPGTESKAAPMRVRQTAQNPRRPAPIPASKEMTARIAKDIGIAPGGLDGAEAHAVARLWLGTPLQHSSPEVPVLPTRPGLFGHRRAHHDRSRVAGVRRV